MNTKLFVYFLIIGLSLSSTTNSYSQPTTPDSAGINSTNRINPNSISPYSPGEDVTTSSVSNYGSVPGCPGDPNRVALAAQNGVYWPAAPACLDRNGHYTPSAKKIIYGSSTAPDNSIALIVKDPVTMTVVTDVNTAYCPDQCTVTQYVSKDVSSGAITGVNRAICPPDYIATNSYNSQPEILYRKNYQLFPPPISQADYYSYIAQNYGCLLVSAGPPTTICKVATGVPSYVSDFFPSPLDTPTMVNGDLGLGMGKYTLSAAHPYTASSNCTTSITDGSYMYCNITPSGSGTSTTCGIVHDQAFSANFIYTPQYYECSAPGGTYYTSATTYAPASTVCSHLKPTWEANP